MAQKERKAPDATQIKKWANADREFWAGRNDVLYDWQKMWEMRHGVTPDPGEESVTLNDGRVLVDKLTAMLMAPHRIDIAAPEGSPELTSAAQKLEAFLRFVRKELSDIHVMAARGTLEYEEAQSMSLRGWLVGRQYLDPSSPEFPFKYDILDIANVYPRYAGDKMLRVTHQYKAKVFELMADFPDADFGDKEEDQEVEVIAYYDQKYHAVLMGSEFIKEPEEHGYGFCPMIIVAAGGAFYGATDKDDVEYRKHKGEGILGRNYQAILDKQQALSMLKTIMAQEANPPASLYTNEDGKVVEADLKAGGRNIFAASDKLELHRVGPGLQEIMGAANIFQDALNRGGFMPSMFGDTQGQSSGFQGYLAIGTAKDVAAPYIKTLETYYSLLYRRFLQLFLIADLPDITFYGNVDGQLLSGLKMTTDDIKQIGVHVNVRFRNVSEQDRIQKAQTGSMLKREQLLSAETVRDSWIDLDNPELENIKILREQVYSNPQVTNAMAIAYAIQMGDPILNQVLQQQKAAGMQPTGPQQPPGMQAGLPGSGMAPQANMPGLPPGVLPPEMGMNAGAPPNTDLLSQQGSAEPQMQLPPDIIQAMAQRVGM